MTTTLTERYIDAVVRTLQPGVQGDVRAELGASIIDDIEARVEQGERREDAERKVITALGDPGILAAGYADRPLHLIGPRYFLTWWRLLKLLLWIVPPIAVAGSVIGQILADAPVGEIIGESIVVGLGVIMHLAFWVTLVFVVLDRSGADTGVRWTPDSLPEPQESGAGRGDLIASLVLLGIFAAFVIWDRLRGVVLISDVEKLDLDVGLGEQTVALSVLNPSLWPWWIGGLFVLLVIEAAFAIIVYARGGWDTALAISNTVLSAIFVIPALWLLSTGELVNPTVVDFIMQNPGTSAGTDRILAILLGMLILGIAVWDVVDGWRKASRARRAVR